jgi:hypothetical protein
MQVAFKNLIVKSKWNEKMKRFAEKSDLTKKKEVQKKKH